VYLATAELDAKLSGEYFVDCKPCPVSVKAKNPVEAEAFWQWTMSALYKYL
jgi:hypothetical protein